MKQRRIVPMGSGEGQQQCTPYAQSYFQVGKPQAEAPLLLKWSPRNVPMAPTRGTLSPVPHWQPSIEPDSSCEHTTTELNWVLCST